MAAKVTSGEAAAATASAIFASQLCARRQEILSSYERRLADKGSRLVRDDAMRREVLAHVTEIFDEVLAELQGGAPLPVGHGRELAKSIGSARAAHGVHPVESLQAAAEFFTAFLQESCEWLGMDADSPLILATLALNRSLLARIREAAVAYNGFLIKKMYATLLDERQQLARNLHDRVGAAVSVGYRQLELFSLHQEAGSAPSAEAAERVESAKQALAQAISDIRQMIADLRLADPFHGLERTLLDYLHAAGETDVVTDVVVNGDEAWVSARVRDEVFLILREALRNALRHGRPRTVLVRIDIAPHELCAAVEDDGRGFDRRKPGSGSGIRSMQERVALLDGIFRISSAEGKGTQVEILIPLEGVESTRAQ